MSINLAAKQTLFVCSVNRWLLKCAMCYLNSRLRSLCIYKIVGSVPLRSVSLNVCTPKKYNIFSSAGLTANQLGIAFTWEAVQCRTHPKVKGHISLGRQSHRGCTGPATWRANVARLVPLLRMPRESGGPRVLSFTCRGPARWHTRARSSTPCALTMHSWTRLPLCIALQTQTGRWCWTSRMMPSYLWSPNLLPMWVQPLLVVRSWDQRSNVTWWMYPLATGRLSWLGKLTPQTLMLCSLEKQEQVRTIILSLFCFLHAWLLQLRNSRIILQPTFSKHYRSFWFQYQTECCFSYYVPGNLKKCASKKTKPLERPSRNLQDTSPHASLEEIKQRKVFDVRRW